MSEDKAEKEREARRRRRLAAAFGEPLPSQTRDESPEAWSEGSSDGAGDDDWLRGQVPPHHG